jgi:putative acetyltransferase
MKVNFRRIEPKDSPIVGRIIRTVMPEFGANGPGFAIHDPEVDAMFETYQLPRCSYFVCEVNRQIMGGGGIAPLPGISENICELKKMYFLPSARGKGYGKQLVNLCLKEAATLGFDKVYLESFHTMQSAIHLYESMGFARIPGSLGNTGHFGCDTFFILDLRNHFADRNM